MSSVNFTSCSSTFPIYRTGFTSLIISLCNSLFDIALHDAFGNLHERDVYETYNGEWMNRSLEDFLEPTAEAVSFAGKYPEDFFVAAPP